MGHENAHAWVTTKRPKIEDTNGGAVTLAQRRITVPAHLAGTEGVITTCEAIHTKEASVYLDTSCFLPQLAIPSDSQITATGLRVARGSRAAKSHPENEMKW